jgi:hypothetical protein
VEALAAAPSIAEEPATMTENNTALSVEDMHKPSHVGGSKRKNKATDRAGGNVSL